MRKVDIVVELLSNKPFLLVRHLFAFDMYLLHAHLGMIPESNDDPTGDEMCINYAHVSGAMILQHRHRLLRSWMPFGCKCALCIKQLKSVAARPF
jgi:hypothetical protein